MTSFLNQTGAKTAVGYDETYDSKEVDQGDQGKVPQPLFKVSSQKTATGYFNDPTDALANGKMQYLEIYHVPTGKNVFFKLFLVNFADAFTSEWNKEPAFGRMDPIATFKRTGRVISFTLDVPSSGLAEAKENLAKANRLIQMLYPVYETSSDPADPRGVTLKSGPIFKVKMGNLIMKPGVGEVQGPAKDIGLTGIIEGFTYAPNMAYGVFDPAYQAAPTTYDSSWDENQAKTKAFFKDVASTFKPSGTRSGGGNGKWGSAQFDGSLYPQVIRVDLRFTVLHDTPLGWEEGKDGALFWRGRTVANGRFPYGGNNKDDADPFAQAAAITIGRPRGLVASALDNESNVLKRAARGQAHKILGMGRR